jgi:hypothetical protein
MLAELGYYRGKADGLIGPNTSSSIKAYQVDRNPGGKPQLDAQLLDSLREDVQAKKSLEHDLAHLNAVNSGVRVMAVSYNPISAKGKYVLVAGNGDAAYRTSDVAELSTELNKYATGRPAANIYLKLESFPAEKADLLISNLRIQELSQGQDVSIAGLSAERDGAIDAVLFSRGVRMEPESVRTEEITGGAQRGLFKTVVEFVVNLGTSIQRVTLTIITRSMEAAQAFISSLTKVRASHPLDDRLFDPSASLVELVSLARADFKLNHPNSKDADVLIRIEQQSGAVQFSELITFNGGRT